MFSFLKINFFFIPFFLVNGIGIQGGTEMLNHTPDKQKKDVTNRLILVGLIVGAIVIIGIIFLVLPYILMNRPEKSDVSEVAPKRIFQDIHLEIQSNVGGAEVYVKGENYERTKLTSSTSKKASFFNLRRGKYEVRLKKEGYQEAVKQIKITGEKPIEKRRIDMTKAGP